MPLVRKPHLAHRLRAVETVGAGGVVTGSSWVIEGTIFGQFEPVRGEPEWLEAGLRDRVQARFLCDVGDAGLVQIGDWLRVQGADWRVVGQPLIFDAEPVTAHAVVYLEATGG